MTRAENDSCPSPEALASLLDGGEDDAVAQHLQGCADCRRLLADAADVGDEIEHVRSGTSLGRYTIVDTLGVGGMGIVYLAHDGELDRDVAIKLALRTEVGARDLERLHGEAKAMARLSHPNVVTVYDVGWLGPHLFLVMEYVRGPSLARWLETKPGTDAVLSKFAAAGEGLLAIHRAGVLHGDFKPSNAVVGDDGLTRVIDFGLAGRSDDVGGELATDEDRRDDEPPTLEVSGPSATGDVLAFGTALRTALSGEPSPRTPRAVRRKLAALLEDPDAEGVLPELVATLVAAQTPSWLRVAKWAVVPALAALAVVGTQLGSPAAAGACRSAADGLLGTWDLERKSQVRERFAARGGAFGERAWASVEGPLDAYAAEWKQRATDACTLAFPTAVQPEVAACIEGQRASLHAVTELLVEAETTTIAKALRIVDTLPELGACGDEPRANPQYAGQLQKVLALRYAKQFEAGRVAAEELVRLAEQGGDPSARAEAAAELGHVLMRTLEPDAALAQLQDAVRLSTEAGDTRRVAESYIAQANVLAIGLGRFDDGMRALDTAAALFDPGHGPRAAIGRVRANLLLYAGRYDACAEAAEQALGFVRASRPATPRAWLQDLSTLAICSSVGGKHAVGRAHAAEALEITEATHGADHPAYADALRVAGVVARNAGDAEATTLLRRAVALYTELEAQGSGKRAELTQTLNNFASALGSAGGWDEAIAVRRRVLQRVDLLPEFPEKRLRARVLLAQDLMAVERFDEATATLLEAESLAASMPQPHPHLQSGIFLNRGIIADRRGEGSEVIAAFERTRALVLPMAAEADIRDNVLPYIDAAAEWYRLADGESGARERLLAAADDARRSKDDCVRAVVFTRAVQALDDRDPRRASFAAEAERATASGLSRACYLAPVVPALGLSFVSRG
ncbi:MAG: protein kinase [Myxococcota bacterium]